MVLQLKIGLHCMTRVVWIVVVAMHRRLQFVHKHIYTKLCAHTTYWGKKREIVVIRVVDTSTDISFPCCPRPQGV